MRPSIFVTQEKTKGLRSLQDLKASTSAGHGQVLFQQLKKTADQNINMEPLTPASVIPGREPAQAKHQNREHFITDTAGQRVMCAALMHLLTAEQKYLDDAIKQMEALFNSELWPIWRDKAPSHELFDADLRTGMLARDVSLAYDWLHPALNNQQRRWVVEGIDRCGVQPYLSSLKARAWWADTDNNWLACVVGGLGIAGMALGEDHPDSAYLIEFALPRMHKYLNIYGPRGEFNESASYSYSANMTVMYFLALYYYSKGQSDDWIDEAVSNLSKASRWSMYFILPPGRNAGFGDAKLQQSPKLWYFTGIAALSQDPQLQWMYSNHLDKSYRRNIPLELLWFDDSLQPLAPDGHFPLGEAFPAHGGCISSRTGWDPRSTACVVYGKAGQGEEKHGHHDVGQLCIDGYGELLIVDLGVPNYPADYFEENRYQYYFASVKGHNVLMLGDQETRTGKHYKAHIVASEFDDQKGGFWQIDMTNLYDGVKSVKRTVIHLHPGHVAVLDEADLHGTKNISLRWHTADSAEPDANGRFMVNSGNVTLAAQMIELSDQPTEFSRKEHRFQAPYNKDRLGEMLPQKNESYVEAELVSNTCRILTLFSVFAPGVDPDVWSPANNQWNIYTLEGLVRAGVEESHLKLENPGQNKIWKVRIN